MAVLTGPRIAEEVAAGNISITPFDRALCRPVSYDVHLADTLSVIIDDELDFWSVYNTRTFRIPPEGYVLRPGRCYLGATVEVIHTDRYVPHYDGTSTCGRYFISSHQTAGRGDPGFRGSFTLEITVQMPVRIYAGMRIGQVHFETLEGPVMLYEGRYNSAAGEPRAAIPH